MRELTYFDVRRREIKLININALRLRTIACAQHLTVSSRQTMPPISRYSHFVPPSIDAVERPRDANQEISREPRR